MHKQKLDAFKGRLTTKQISAGINAANKNAQRLLNDAKILLKHKKFASAVSLAVLSIEEAGKASILRGMAVAKTDKEISDCWRDYRTHTKKNVAWLLPEIVTNGARSLDDFKILFDINSEHPYLLDQIKQIGFYTDCLGNGHWSIPEEVIDEALANMLVNIAQIMVKHREVSIEEIDLWVQYMGPVWKTSTEKMKEAISEWHRELVSRGLISGDEDDMEKFITTGI